ncbi:tetratricopeptide repeat protein [Roseitranquillus sediminis]|uniref:tetratricopeptide repeat protein n=1 Tax=Roseitranquillus sediminis TaxID=2809051 RepID=UPI001D0C1074|nr:tetratricopeptide repeat protein [Roseitranquillus sediminis]MBM9596184.1 tetratricopeptide repeat protein [Roseitranquillus sediminis]
MSKFRSLALPAALVLALSACDSAEERAEAHFQQGVELLEAGDVDRALVEFRNVFQLDGTHREARRLFAEAELGRGRLQSGYSHYLRLVEQYPDDIEALRRLTRLALDRGEWQEVERHGAVLVQAQPDDATAQLVDLYLRYRQAVEAEDTETQAEIAAEAAQLQGDFPEEHLLQELVADQATRTGAWETALAEIDEGLEIAPDQRSLYAMRLGVLQELGDLDGVAQQLRDMAVRFPDDQSIPQTLIRWYLSQNNLDAAELYLREQVEAGVIAGMDLALIEFLSRFRGIDVALAEVDRMIAAGEGEAEVLRALRAGLRFEQGERESAIAELQALVDEAETETDRLRDVKIALATMLAQTGNQVGARALVEDVLASDPSHVAAIKMQSTWLIEADEIEQAILTLRRALDQSPRDPELMTLMAQAHERAGNRQLMGEMLSLAVEASNRAPAESIRYAEFLLGEGNVSVAERTLINSLRLNPNHPAMLRLLGATHIRQGDWSRAEQVVRTLQSLDIAEASAFADSLQAQILTGRGQSTEVVNFLQQLIDEGRGGLGARMGIVQSHIENGNIDAATAYVEALLEEEPDNRWFRFVRASLAELSGDAGTAEKSYVDLVEENPESVAVWRALYVLQSRAGREDDARATLERALAANPSDPDLLWIQASELQAQGDDEAALQIYAQLYEENSSAPIIANNYASLLSTLRDDPESINRAWTVARRLRDSDVPAFQDTFGWLAYLRQDYPLALDHLEPAAEALSEDPAVQYHLGLTYAALERFDEAAAALERSIELAVEGAPHVADARARLEEIQAEDAAAQ